MGSVELQLFPRQNFSELLSIRNLTGRETFKKGSVRGLKKSTAAGDPYIRVGVQVQIQLTGYAKPCRNCIGYNLWLQ